MNLFSNSSGSRENRMALTLEQYETILKEAMQTNIIPWDIIFQYFIIKNCWKKKKKLIFNMAYQHKLKTTKCSG